jgi:hypothetical protein
VPSQHIWTEKDQDGKKREVRATKFGGVWRFQSKTAGDLAWTYHDRALLEDLLTLKEILVRKYQRRRASAEDVASIGTLIEEQAIGTPRRPESFRDSAQRTDPTT